MRSASAWRAFLPPYAVSQKHPGPGARRFTLPLLELHQLQADKYAQRECRDREHEVLATG